MALQVTTVNEYTKYDRQYKITIGDYVNGDGIELISTEVDAPLQITFNIEKSADTKHKNGNSGSIEIYNLNPEQALLMDRKDIEVALYVGYNNRDGMKLLASGNMTKGKTVKHGTDTISVIELGEGYVELTQARLSRILSPGQTVGDVIETIRESMPGVARGSIVGTNLNSPIIGSYRLSATAKEELDKITKAYGFQYHVTNGILNVTDVNGPNSRNIVDVPIISVDTGMIDEPFQTTEYLKLPKGDKRARYGVQVATALDATIVPSSVVKIESEKVTGYYRVNTARYTGDFRGNDWQVEIQCSEMTPDDIDVLQ